MPTSYNFRENGLDYSFDDIFVPADMFRDGNLWTWGRSNNGQLGNGQISSISTPVTTFAGGTNWKQVSSGLEHTAAIKTDGTLWTWGYGAFGQLGNAQINSRSTPVTTFAGGNDWKQVDVAAYHTVAIKTDGTLWTWGIGSTGVLGNGTTTGNRSTPVTTFAGGTNWKQVRCGTYHTAAIKTDGTLWTWGVATNGVLGNTFTSGNRFTPVTTFAGGNDWNKVSCGNYYTGATKTDGTLWVWGNGFFGQLGNAQSINVSTPVTTFAGGNDWKHIEAGVVQVAAIKTDGTLWTWGQGSYGRLGNASTTFTSTPVTTFAGGNDWKRVNGGTATHMAAIKTDGTLWAWGANNYFGFSAIGQLGNAQSINVSTPVTTFAGGNDWKQVSCGNYYTTALTYIDSVI